MDAGLKRRIENALKEACHPDGDAQVRLDDTSGTRVGGVVTSAVFEGMTPAERQDRIWKKLDEVLSEYERTLITFLVAETPDEYQVVRQYPTLDKVDPDEFAHAVTYRLKALGAGSDVEELGKQAHAISAYARTGDGLSSTDARLIAERIAEALGYAPLSRATEDGYGIVLLGALGRAKLKEGAPVTAKELHVLATLVPGSRSPIAGGATGEVPYKDAVGYLSKRGIRVDRG